MVCCLLNVLFHSLFYLAVYHSFSGAFFSPSIQVCIIVDPSVTKTTHALVTWFTAIYLIGCNVYFFLCFEVPLGLEILLFVSDVSFWIWITFKCKIILDYQLWFWYWTWRETSFSWRDWQAPLLSNDETSASSDCLRLPRSVSGHTIAAAKPDDIPTLLGAHGSGEPSIIVCIHL